MAYRTVLYINQFFSGQGGEEAADLPPQLLDGARGPGLLLARRFPEIEVLASLTAGDNFMARHPEQALAAMEALLAPLFADPARRPDLLLAGPAFNAGRYGLACGAVCRMVGERFGIVTVTAMDPDNPAVAEYRRSVLIARAGTDVLSMEASLGRMARLGVKLLRGEVPDPEADEYLPRGRRQNVFVEENGARRAVAMLLQKLAGAPFVTEYPMPIFDRVAPAPALAEMRHAKLALVTSGGIVPKGNPDRIEAAAASRFGVYPLRGLTRLSADSHQTAHGGYDPTYANADPNRVLPLDAVRELLAEGAFGALHEWYYATVGNATSVANARRFGREIAEKLLADGVRAAILTST